MGSFQLLFRLFKDQCTSVDDLENKGKKFITAKPNHEVPSDSLQNPYDEDSAYNGHKGQGYQVPVMETYSVNTDKNSCLSSLTSKLSLQINTMQTCYCLLCKTSYPAGRCAASND